MPRPYIFSFFFLLYYFNFLLYLSELLCEALLREAGKRRLPAGRQEEISLQIELPGFII